MADARLGAQSNEAITDSSPSRQLAGIAVDALTTQETTPSRQLAAISNDILTSSAAVPERQLGSLTVEVLVPARLTFVGWGSPVRSPIWT